MLILNPFGTASFAPAGIGTTREIRLALSVWNGGGSFAGSYEDNGILSNCTISGEAEPLGVGSATWPSIAKVIPNISVIAR